jgi:hypothetical protein
MKALLFLYLILVTDFAMAIDGATGLQVEHKKRGAFSLTPYMGSQWLTIQNSNGNESSYQGISYGLGGTLILIGEPGAGLGAGLNYEGTYSPHVKLAGETLTSSEVTALFELQMGPAFFVSGAIGSRQVKVENFEGSANYESRMMGVGIGIDLLSVSPSFDVGLQAWYKMSLAAKSRNDGISATLGDESFDVIIGLRWTPVVSFNVTD